jgi:hypothetical protein
LKSQEVLSWFAIKSANSAPVAVMTENQGRSVTLDWRFLLDESPIFLSTIWYIKIMTKL